MVINFEENTQQIPEQAPEQITQTPQSNEWANDFGKEYTNRNPHSIEEFDKLYIENYGITRTNLNKLFLEELPKSIKILEVGPNVGAQLMGLQKLGFTNLTGLEVSEYAIEQAKENTSGIEFIHGSGLSLPFPDNSFDLVFTSGVLIHIHPDDVGKVVSEICRVSKRLIWGFEYFAENCQEVSYRGNSDLLWKNNFMQLFLSHNPNLRILKEKKVNYLDDQNVDHMFLLEKQN